MRRRLGRYGRRRAAARNPADEQMFCWLRDRAASFERSRDHWKAKANRVAWSRVNERECVRAVRAEVADAQRRAAAAERREQEALRRCDAILSGETQ